MSPPPPLPADKALQERSVVTIEEVACAFANRGVLGGADKKKDSIVKVLKSEHSRDEDGYDGGLLPSDRFTKVAQPAFKNLVDLMLKIDDDDVQRAKLRNVSLRACSRDAMILAACLHMHHCVKKPCFFL